MKFLLIAIGSAGDVHPYIGVGKALAERGHDITLATSPKFADRVERAGLTLLPLGTVEDYDRIERNPDLWHPTRGLGVILNTIVPVLRDQYELVMKYCENEGGVVVAHGLALGARVAQEAKNAPVASMILQPSAIRSLIAPPALIPIFAWPLLPKWALKLMFKVTDDIFIDRHLAGPLNGLRAEFGLPPTRKFFDEWWHSPELTVGLFPEWIAPPQADWPRQIRLTEFPLYDDDQGALPDAVDAFLAAGDAPVLFTPGSAMIHGDRFFSESLRAVRSLGVRAIFVTPNRDSAPRELPDSVLYCRYAPYSRLFPRCSVIVHHGGIGTSAQAMAAGRPQLIMPLTHDQPDNAHRIKKLGVSETLPAGRYNARRAAALLHRLLESQDVQRNARALQARFPHNPFEKTCILLEQFAATRSKQLSK